LAKYHISKSGKPALCKVILRGAGQMNTVFSWGTCKKSGIIKNIGRAKIC